jgi:hypothetical protein
MTKRRLNHQKNQLERRHGAAAQIAQPEDFEPSHFIVISSAQREILLVLTSVLSSTAGGKEKDFSLRSK